jgi:hypothetical protein
MGHVVSCTHSYERQSSRSPHVDISSFGIFSANHSFFGTLHNPDLFVDKDSVILADLLQSPGHQLHRVLAASGCKTLITVEDVTTAESLKPDICLTEMSSTYDTRERHHGTR